MFGNLGMSEIMIIAVVALVVLGPEKFPEYAKIALRAYRDFRGYIDDIKREMAQELKPVKEEIRELARHNPEEYIDDLTKAISSVDSGKKSGDASVASEGAGDSSEASSGAAGAETVPDPYAEPRHEQPESAEVAATEPPAAAQHEQREPGEVSPADEHPARLDG